MRKRFETLDDAGQHPQALQPHATEAEDPLRSEQERRIVLYKLVWVMR